MIEIIPDINIKNSNYINNLYFYKPPLKRTKIKKDKIILYDQMSITYMIQITKDNISFFLDYPNEYKDLIKTELNIAYPKATFKDSKTSLNFKNPAIVKLDYKYHYFLSLRIDKRSESPLVEILETQKLMKGKDKALVQIVFEPDSPDWYRTIENCIKDFKKGYVLPRMEVNRKNLTDLLLKGSIKALQETLSIISFFLTNDEMEFDDINNVEHEELLRQGLSRETLNKSKWNGFNTQIRLVADSTDKIRKDNILRSLTIAFRNIEKDNKLVAKEVDSKYLKYIKGRKIKFELNKNIMSAAELSQLIQLPTKAYQEMYNIVNIDDREIQVPAGLLTGNIPIGIMEHKGIRKQTYWPDNKNVLALPKIIVGPMEAGKSEYTKNFCVAAAKKGDSVIVFDYIKNCELSGGISKHVDCIKIDLSRQENLFALAYPELQPEGSNWQRLKVANMLSRQVEYLINALVEEPLSSRMARYLDAACKVVFIHSGTTVNDVIEVLTNWKIRNEFIRKSRGVFSDDDMEIVDLESLHERNGEGKILGTKEGKIEGILDRINVLMKDIYLRAMLKAKVDYSINFCEYMDKGKVILIQLPQSTFTNKQVKDTITTYFMSRVWLSALTRKTQNMVHIVTDEIHQVPTTAKLVSGVITEGRKFGIDFYFTLHYLKQFKALHDAVRSAGCSYMLLAGTEKENFKALEEEILPFTVLEGLNLKPYHSLNIINYGNQYCRYISKMPKPI